MAEVTSAPRTQDSGYASDEDVGNLSDPKNDTHRSSSKEPAAIIALAVKEISNVIDDKHKTSYDLFRLLDKYKGAMNPVHIIVEGLNLIQIILEKNRLVLLAPVVQVGWWTILKDKKCGTGSIYKGRTARQIAETKRTRKTLDEFLSNQEWDSSLTPLMRACRSRDISRADQLTENQGTDTFFSDYNGNNCLYWALISGDVEFFEKLVSLGLNAKTRNNKGETLLHVAAQTGRHQFIGKLLNKYQLSPALLDSGKKTALDRASEAGDVEVLTEFVKCGVRPEANAPSLSAFAERLVFLRFLLETLEMCLESKDIYGRTALHRACEGANVDIVRYLLQRGSSVGACTVMGRNVLHIAAEAGNDVIMNLIIDALKKNGGLAEALNKQDKYNGVDLCFLIRGRDKGRDAFHYVEVERFKVSIFLKRTKAGNVDIAEFGSIIKSGWGVNPSEDVVDEIEEIFKNRRLDTTAVSDMTPLHIAVNKGHSRIVKKLVELGADGNVRDKFGLTPILLAAGRGDLDTVTLLEKAGADTKVKCTAGHNIKDLAEINEHDKIINFAASDEAYLIAEMFVNGPLNQLLTKLDQLPRRGKLSTDKNKRDLQAPLRELGSAVDKVLFDIGSSPVQQASDDTNGTQDAPGTAGRSSTIIVSPAHRSDENTSGSDHRTSSSTRRYEHQMPHEGQPRQMTNTSGLESVQRRYLWDNGTLPLGRNTLVS